MNPIDRFEALYTPEPNTGCWLWMGSINQKTGYARFSFRGRNALAHRFAYEHFKGPIPEGMQVDHLCRQRCCVNPDHLEAVTQRENIFRGTSPVVRLAQVTHCPKGHAYDADNTRIKLRDGRIGRDCRACHNRRESERTQRKREACA